MKLKSTLPLAAAIFALSSIIPAKVQAQAATAAEKASAVTLKMGDPAPKFKATAWYKGDPVTLDDKGTFIVECWATWCGPCIAAFPHLSELAKANEGKIKVIGVNVWEKKTAEEVKAFVANQGDKMSYHVAADGDSVVTNDWLKAAGKTGIPCAFVVSKGKVAWIGHPAALDQKLLSSITSGTYDIAAAAKADEAEQAAGNYFNQHVSPLLSKKDNAGAIVELEKMKKEFPDQEATINGHIARLKAQLPKEKP